MKTTSFAILISLLGSMLSVSYSQTCSRAEIPLDAIHTVVLLTGDHLTITPSSSHSLKAESCLFTKGRIVGFRFPRTRPEFTTGVRIQGDTLFLQVPEKHLPATVGFRSYEETILTRISIPMDAMLHIIKADTVEVETYGRKLFVDEAEYVHITIPDPTAYGLIQLSAGESLILNREDRGEELEILGLGEEQVHVSAGSIHVDMESTGK